MRFSRHSPPWLATVAVAALLMPMSADAQFWAKQPGSAGGVATAPGDQPAAQPDSADDDQAPQPQAGQRTIIREPTLSAPPAPGSSLGGSGDTGTDSIGILPSRDTDFGRETWRYTAFNTVLGLMRALPDRIDSAAAHELAKNLLVSIADAPQGDDGGSRLLSIRVRKLFAMGNITDAAALARAMPGVPDDADLARTEVEAEVLNDPKSRFHAGICIRHCHNVV